MAVTLHEGYCKTHHCLRTVLGAFSVRHVLMSIGCSSRSVGCVCTGAVLRARKQGHSLTPIWVLRHMPLGQHRAIGRVVCISTKVETVVGWNPVKKTGNKD